MDKHSEKNRLFREEVGKKWHEYSMDENLVFHCSCGHKTYIEENRHKNPDYAADPRLVLREMMKRKRWVDFLDVVGVGGNTEINSMIDVHYILDTSGKLRDAAIEFMKK